MDGYEVARRLRGVFRVGGAPRDGIDRVVRAVPAEAAISIVSTIVYLPDLNYRLYLVYTARRLRIDKPIATPNGLGV